MKTLIYALRSLFRFRLYSLINIVGLAICLSSIILLTRYINQELRTNHFIENVERVAFLTRDRENLAQKTPAIEFGKYSDADILKDPAIAGIAPFKAYGENFVLSGEKKYKANILVADSNYFTILTYPIQKAESFPLLNKPNEAVITASFAKLMFGKEDPIGKVIETSVGVTTTIAAIVSEPDTQNSFPYDVFLHLDGRKEWNIGTHFFVKLFAGTDLKQLNQKYGEFNGEPGSRFRDQLEPLNQLYFNNSILFFDKTILQGNKTHVNILLIVTCLLLLVGIFNFINIYTVVQMKRGREFGLYKLFGAGRKDIFFHIYVENLGIVIIALFFAWILVEVLTGPAHTFLDIPMILNPSFGLWLSIGMCLVLPAITSIYPYLRYMYVPPVENIKPLSGGKRKLQPKTVILTVQYMVTISLIIVSLFFVKQLKGMLNQDIGYNTNHILRTQLVDDTLGWDDDAYERIYAQCELVRNRIKDIPYIKQYTFGEPLNSIRDYDNNMKVPGKEYQQVKQISTTEALLTIFGLKAKQGRLWDDTKDSYKDFSIIINETAYNLFGFDNLDEAYLESDRLYTYDEENYQRVPVYKVIGVVPDFQVGHLSKSIPPIVMHHLPSWENSYLLAELVPGAQQMAINALKELRRDVDGMELQYSFIEDENKAFYAKDKQLAGICGFFALLAIVVSSLGLFSLSLFDIQLRYREIAIRKVNGANVPDITALFLRKYILLLLVAFVVSAPLSWLAIQSYLEGFAFRSPVSWWLYATAFAITLLISLSTLIFHIYKAARTNPSEALKTE